jgi:hypothetical protein
MMRFLSFIIATIFLVSATVEIASFAIDHQSWFKQNYAVMRETVDAWLHPEKQIQQAQQACEAACQPVQPASERRCDDIEELGKKILCHITLPKSDAACRKECAQKNRPSVPGNWFKQDSKGKMASAGPLL